MIDQVELPLVIIVSNRRHVSNGGFTITLGAYGVIFLWLFYSNRMTNKKSEI